MSTALQDKKEKYTARLNFVQNIWKQSKTTDGKIDFRKSEALRNLPDDDAARLRMTELEDELSADLKEISTWEASLEQERRFQEMYEKNQEIPPHEQHIHGGVPATQNGHGLIQPVPFKTLGELCAEVHPKRKLAGNQLYVNKEFSEQEYDIRQLITKATLTTTTAWPPEVTRTGRFVDFAYRPIQVIEMFPVGATTQAAVAYMEETSQTNTAAETAEGAQMPQSEFATVEKQVNIRKIATYMTVTDEQLADVPQMQALIDQRLRLFVQQRLDLQVMQGNGVGVNILGLLNVPGILSYARGAETNFDAIFRAMANVQTTGRATTTGIIVHPTNWVTIRLATANGLYIYGAPTEAGIQRLWGVPVTVADVVPAGTAVVGDFQTHSQLVTRQGIEILAGFIADDFQRGQQSIRATLRVALVVYRPSAFSTVTNLN